MSGLWHGANWTFIAWGLFHSIIYILYTLYTRTNLYQTTQKLPNFINSILLFILIVFSWVIFRSETIEGALIYTQNIFTNFKFASHINPYNNLNSFFYLIYVGFFLFADFMYMKFNFSDKGYNTKLSVAQNIFFLTMILLFSQIDASNAFIYFQF